MKCRFCFSEVDFEFLDLDNSPLSNSLLTKKQLDLSEDYYPLKILVCKECFLVQVEENINSEIIFCNDYVYFSSYSSSWLTHCKQYVQMIIKRLKLTNDSKIIEIASNDGYLLQYFIKQNIPVIGIEPTDSTADAAMKKGINTIKKFFNIELAKSFIEKNIQANLIICNNVFAHVPDINNFVEGLKILLAEKGTITLEFPHLLNLINKTQFDTIYHEHYSYFSCITAKMIFQKHGLEIYDVDEIPTHGGSLRLYVKHIDDHTNSISNSVFKLLEKEVKNGMDQINFYMGFQEKVNLLKNRILSFLNNKKSDNKLIAAYGAAAKGNTLLNYCGIKKDLIQFVVDKSPFKINKYLPGSHIPIVSESKIKELKPDFILIFPWNIKNEIMEQLSYIKEWDGKFVTVIPDFEIIP